MESHRIELSELKNALDAIFEHLTNDLGIRYVDIGEDLYWEILAPDKYDGTKVPEMPGVGSLRDDLAFSRHVYRGQSGDASYKLVHIAPLLTYIAEKVGR